MNYLDYLKQTGTQLFDGAGTCWQIYQGGLIPAMPLPKYVDMDAETGRRLLSESRAHLIRWSSDPSSQEMPWWWVVCDKYDVGQFSSKMRNMIKRGYKKCEARCVTTEWLAEFGYECYRAAFSRYSHATPASEDDFRANILKQVGYESVFENWGVFVEDRLAGYAQCIVEDEKGVATNVIKYDPDYMRDYTSYAMMDTLLNHYVAGKGLPMSNGTRAVSHDSNVQDFLLKFGFRRQYCRLNVQYRRSLGLAISMLHPFRKFIPGWAAMHNVKALLFQERLRRTCR